VYRLTHGDWNSSFDPIKISSIVTLWPAGHRLSIRLYFQRSHHSDPLPRHSTLSPKSTLSPPETKPIQLPSSQCTSPSPPHPIKRPIKLWDEVLTSSLSLYTGFWSWPPSWLSYRSIDWLSSVNPLTITQVTVTSSGVLSRTKTTTWSDFHWGRDGESNRSPHPRRDQNLVSIFTPPSPPPPPPLL
jgi:hypothetical protein